ncbi:MAG: Hpt domain-containing protein [Gemmataceae bacterium]|nr:Hpt domain-containing protein [Gemmata sp.]MDW8198263.1 Hpt domain-containing protein [Gemmataceae bacterium]
MNIDGTRYRATFFEEAVEHLAALEAALLRLDANPADAAAVDDAFRAAHSLKGGADVVGLGELAQMTHRFENILERFRHAAPIPRPMVDRLLEATDALTHIVATLRRGESPSSAIEELQARLDLDCEPIGWYSSPHEEQPRAPSPPDSSVRRDPPTTYRITVTPHPEAFRSGLDPLVVLRTIEELGTLRAVKPHLEQLPRLRDLDPERCYMSWTVQLETDQSPEAIRQACAFAGEVVELTIEPESARRPVCEDACPASVMRSVSENHPCAVSEPLALAKFLVERQVLTAEQALEALYRHRGRYPTLGDLAVEVGLLTKDQLRQLRERLAPGNGFAQAVVAGGYLTDSDLGRLLRLQEQRIPVWSEDLINDGLVDRTTMAAELAAFATHATAAQPISAVAEHPAASDVSLPTETSAVADHPAASDVSLPAETVIPDDSIEMLPEFCAEATEHLEAADRHLLSLDNDPTNAEALNAIYRGFHTIKGVSSMLRLEVIRTLAHETENLLNRARDGEIILQDRYLDLAFASTDALKQQIHNLRQWTPGHGPLPTDPALTPLLAELRRVGTGRSAETGAPEKPAAAAVRSEAVSVAVHTPAHHPGTEGSSTAPPRVALPDKETVRVDKERLDKLTNTIGELVIAQSMVQQEFDELTAGSGWHSRALPELNKISRDLQELSLSLRMVPLQGIFQKMSRLVRDLSRKMNKPVELELHGEEIELDKTVVDQLGDPLMHMVRNAVDHGIEAADERRAAGKPPEGRITLRAYHQGGNVFIELSDDGRGLDRDRLWRKGIEKGLVTEGQRLTDAEIYALIFAPGFSTAAAVTDVSGRGVGMDVVRRNIEALQGSIAIRTQPGQGTTFTIRLPLTLAIMDGLMVGLGEDVYVVPLLSVVESFRPRASDVHLLAGQGEVVRVRHEVMPLVRLYRVLRRPARVSDPWVGLVVVVEDQGKKYALLVDELLGQIQAVVKSLDANFRRVEGLAGATILGDGRVAMILDVHGLTQIHAQQGFMQIPHETSFLTTPCMNMAGELV